MLTDQHIRANPKAHSKDMQPFRMRLKRGERYVKLYKQIVNVRAAIVARETIKSYNIPVSRDRGCVERWHPRL